MARDQHELAKPSDRGPLRHIVLDYKERQHANHVKYESAQTQIDNTWFTFMERLDQKRCELMEPLVRERQQAEEDIARAERHRDRIDTEIRDLYEKLDACNQQIFLKDECLQETYAEEKHQEHLRLQDLKNEHLAWYKTKDGSLLRELINTLEQLVEDQEANEMGRHAQEWDKRKAREEETYGRELQRGQKRRRVNDTEDEETGDESAEDEEAGDEDQEDEKDGENTEMV